MSKALKESGLVESAVAAFRNPAKVVRAAGGVVYRSVAESGDVEIALVHRPAYKDWSLPKGKLKDGERLEVAALREVEEETGLSCLIARTLGTIHYVDRRGADKVVWYWLMRALDGAFKPGAEVDQLVWLPFNQAVAKLSYPHDRDLVQRARDLAPENVKVHVVRHADAGARGSWKGVDQERPLTKKGLRRAEGLVRILDGQAIARILSSPAVRCLQTVEPLARARELNVEEEPRLAEGTPWSDVLELIRDTEVSSVFCTHGDVVSALVDQLAMRGVVRDRPARLEKSSTWTLTVHEGDIVGAQHLPPS